MRRVRDRLRRDNAPAYLWQSQVQLSNRLQVHFQWGALHNVHSRWPCILP